MMQANKQRGARRRLAIGSAAAAALAVVAVAFAVAPQMGGLPDPAKVFAPSGEIVDVPAMADSSTRLPEAKPAQLRARQAAFEAEEATDDVKRFPAPTEGLISNLPDYEENVALVAPAQGVSAAELQAALASSPYVAQAAVDESKANRGVVSVQLEPGADEQAALEALAALPEVDRAQPNYYYYTLDTHVPTSVVGAIGSIAQSALGAGSTAGDAKSVGAAAVEQAEVVKGAAVASGANDEFAEDLWGLESVNAYEAWDFANEQGVQDKAVTVAVLDTGCYIEHDDLADSIVATADISDMFEDDEFGDIMGHGTHVCGIVAAQANNGVGVAGVGGNKVGVLPVEVFYPARTWWGGLTAYTSTELLIEAYDWLIDNADTYNIRVSSMSLGRLDEEGMNETDYIFKDSMERAREVGILSVAAAGNDDSVLPNLPSDSMDTGLAVISLEQAENAAHKVQRSSFSNYNKVGSTTKTISAPGSDILSTYLGGEDIYAFMSGTSMATPMVAGIAGLVFGVNPDLTPMQAKGVIEKTAIDLYTDGFDIQSGFGEIDAAAAVKAASNYDADSFACATVDPIPGKLFLQAGSYRPTPTVRIGDKVLKPGSDYTVSGYDESISRGLGVVTIAPAGSYSGKPIKATYQMQVRDFSIGKAIGVDIEDIPDQAYTGKQVKVAPTVTFNGQQLREGVDYKLSYKDNVKWTREDAKCVITGMGAWAGETIAKYGIKYDVSIATTKGFKSKLTYDGLEKEQPDLKLYHKNDQKKNVEMTEEWDYSAVYDNNVNVGTATLDIVCEPGYWADYIGEKKLTYQITPFKITAKAITSDVEECQYWAADEPSEQRGVEVMSGDEYLEEGRDYVYHYENNTSAGLAKLVVEGIGSCTGTAVRTFKILPLDLENVRVDFENSMEYDGTPQRALKRAYLYEDLVEGRDYTITYKNNTMPGTATMKIKGKGSYKGTITENFDIYGDMEDTTPSVVKDVTYTGREFKPKPTVKLGSKTLRAGKDYDVYWKNNVGAGTASVILSGGEYFIGDKVVNFEIAKAKQSFTAKATSKSIALSSLKVNALTMKGIFSVSKTAYGRLTYEKVSGSDCIAIDSSTGNVTVARGTTKGKYTAKVSITAAGDRDYLPATKTVTLTVSVK